MVADQPTGCPLYAIRVALDWLWHAEEGIGGGSPCSGLGDENRKESEENGNGRTVNNGISRLFRKDDSRLSIHCFARLGTSGAEIDGNVANGSGGNVGYIRGRVAIIVAAVLFLFLVLLLVLLLVLVRVLVLCLVFPVVGICLVLGLVLFRFLFLARCLLVALCIVLFCLISLWLVLGLFLVVVLFLLVLVEPARGARTGLVRIRLV